MNEGDARLYLDWLCLHFDVPIIPLIVAPRMSGQDGYFETVGGYRIVIGSNSLDEETLCHEFLHYLFALSSHDWEHDLIEYNDKSLVVYVRRKKK